MQQTKQLAIVGCGKMGTLINQLSPEYGFDPVLRLDSQNNRNGKAISAEAFAHVDVAIEFSSPEAAPRNLKLLAEVGIPVVTGTTGWFNHLPEIERAVNSSRTGLVWSANYSIGVAVFQKAVGLTARLLAAEENYGAWAWEIHHSAKRDAPSGTLLRLIETMEESGYSRTVDVSSNRAGMHPGTHEIGFDSAADTITLRHTARNREGFARGALKAALWLGNRKGVYTFEDVLFGSAPDAIAPLS